MTRLPSALGRRGFSLGVATVLGSGLLPRFAGAAGPRVLIAGGSTMGGALGMYLEQQLEKLGYRPHRRNKGSSGLARPDFFDWPKEAARLQRNLNPDGVIVLFGGNDGQGLFMGKKADPPWIRWHEDGWSEEYARRVKAFADAAAPGSTHLFWIGMPVMRSKKLHARVSRMNAIFKAAMDERPTGHFIDTFPLLANENGRYTDFKTIRGKQVRLRGHDGVHLSGPGATVIVDNVIPEVKKHLAIGS